MFKKGKKNFAYKDGRSLKQYYCLKCGKKLASYLSKRCRSCNEKLKQKGKNNPMYRAIGTKRISNKYMWIKYADNRWEREHTHKVEHYLKRKLQKGETIHHIDGNTLNNRLSNLYVFPKAGLHNSFECLIKYKIVDRFILKSNLKNLRRQ